MSDRQKLPLLFVTSLIACVLLMGAAGAGSEKGKRIKMRDDCEAVSFNFIFGPGICQGDGRTTFDRFIGQVIRHGEARKWKFEPEHLDLARGEHLVLENEGGEFHTWTEVAEFGGGFVPELNAGLAPRPECFAPPTINNIGVEFGEEETGAIAGSPDLPKGTHKFQCCIHPWMHTVVKVKK